MPISLDFEYRSLYANTISCDRHGIRYQISRGSDDVITIKRWDSQTDSMISVYELKLPYFTKEMYRKSGEAAWKPMKQLLKKTRGDRFARVFRGYDGQEYRWDVLDQIVTLSPGSEDNSQESALAWYNWARHAAGERSSLEILDHSVLKSLDIIILTFLVFEKNRRDGHQNHSGNIISALMTSYEGVARTL